MEVKITEGLVLIISKNVSPYNKEINIFLESKDGYQDIVTISPSYEHSGDTVEYSDKEISVKLWTDCQNEDFTEEHLIPISKDLQVKKEETKYE